MMKLTSKKRIRARSLHHRHQRWMRAERQSEPGRFGGRANHRRGRFESISRTLTCRTVLNAKFVLKAKVAMTNIGQVRRLILLTNPLPAYRLITFFCDDSVEANENPIFVSFDNDREFESLCY